MKRLLMILTFAAGTFSVSAQGFVAPRALSATPYDAMCELRFDNEKSFTYEIYRAKQGRSDFKLIGITSLPGYIDHLGRPLATAEAYTYRVVPKGLNPKSKDAEALCQVSVIIPASSDDAMLDAVQRFTTRYFYDFSHPTYGLTRERSNNNIDMLTTGGTGFGLMALVAGMERGYFTRQQGLTVVERVVSFLENCERFHGAWAHWYNAADGSPFSFSKYDDGGDLVETAFLVSGLLTVRSYLDTPADEALRNRITALWERVEWDWYTAGTDDKLFWHWSKNWGWKMNHRIKGFDETLITYVLAASSPTHPIKAEVYEQCYKNSDYYYNGKEYFGIPLSLGMDYGGPLFFTHYSFLGLNPNGLCDSKVNYFQRNRAHALIHRAYAVANPKGWKNYGSNLWGFTSSDDSQVGYSSHHPGTDADNGTVSPTAAVSSIVYTPDESLEVIRNLYYNLSGELFGYMGFYDAYNPSLVEGCRVSKSYLAIDQGPIAVMIENYRSGLLWRLFAANGEVADGLAALGFRYDNQN